MDIKDITEVSEIHILADGCRGGWEVTITGWKNKDAWEEYYVKTHCLYLQGVEELIRDLRLRAHQRHQSL